MNVKPEIVLEFDLVDVVFIRPGPPPTSGGPAPKEILEFRSRTGAAKVAIYAVVDGRVTPIAIPDGCSVELVVSR